jgi:hypothetical protein
VNPIGRDLRDCAEGLGLLLDLVNDVNDVNGTTERAAGS